MVINIRPGLRADVHEVVKMLVEACPSVPTENDYIAAKRRISEACGYDAPAVKFDQVQFERAIQAYCSAVGY